MKKIITLIFFLLITASCSIQNEENLWDNTGNVTPIDTGTTIPVDTGSINEEHQEPLTHTASGSTNEYTFFFENGVKEETVNMQHKTGEETRVYFINTQTGSMNVSIAFPKDTQWNLRLAQIVMPDGTMDGPFGQDTDYELTQLGGYQLLFHENMMAGDPWSGEVSITVKLSE